MKDAWSIIASHLLPYPADFLSLKLTCRTVCKACRIAERELRVLVRFDGYDCWRMIVEGRPRADNPGVCKAPMWYTSGWFDFDEGDERMMEYRRCRQVDLKEVSFWTTIGQVRCSLYRKDRCCISREHYKGKTYIY